jgi:hypothetical protein
MINAFEFAFIPGLMFGIEFPSDETTAFFVIDLGILRVIWWRIPTDDLE